MKHDKNNKIDLIERLQYFRIFIYESKIIESNKSLLFIKNNNQIIVEVMKKNFDNDNLVMTKIKLYKIVF